MRKDNRGFSLVEIIVVVAIMSVLVGLVGMGVGMLGNKPAQECAKKMTSTLQRTQRVAAGRSYNQVTITRNGSGSVVVIQNYTGAGATDVETTVVGKRDVQVSYTLDGGATFQNIDAVPLTFSFDRSSGSMNYANGGGSYCTQIKITQGTTWYIDLVPLSGKISVR